MTIWSPEGTRQRTLTGIPIRCVSCGGSGRCMLPQYDPLSMQFGEIDIGPCFNCSGSGITEVVELHIRDNTYPPYYGTQYDTVTPAKPKP